MLSQVNVNFINPRGGFIRNAATGKALRLDAEDVIEAGMVFLAF